MSKGLEKHYQQKAKEQLKCWDRYVWAKSYLRLLKLTGVNIDTCLNSLIGKHYTLTEAEFNEIKDLYNERFKGTY